MRAKIHTSQSVKPHLAVSVCKMREGGGWDILSQNFRLIGEGTILEPGDGWVYSSELESS